MVSIENNILSENTNFNLFSAMFVLGHNEASLLENGRIRQPGKARHGTGTTI